MTSATQDGVTTTYSVDSLGQLLGEWRSGYAATYAYDANGNRTSRTLNGLAETYSYDAGDKLLSVTWPGGSKTYGYDNDGRVTSVVGPSGTTTLAYDHESRVTSITGPGLSQTFSYNGLGTRVGLTGTGGARTFHRAGAGVTAPVVSDGTATFTPGISERRSSSTRFVHHGLMSIEAQSSGSSVVASRVYDAFGNQTSSVGSWARPFGHAGGFGYQEDPSRLQLLGHRYYDPSTGRFLTRDPIREDRPSPHCSSG